MLQLTMDRRLRGREPSPFLQLIHLLTAALKVSVVVRASAIGGHLDLHATTCAAELIALLRPLQDPDPCLLARLGHALCDFIHCKPILVREEFRSRTINLIYCKCRAVLSTLCSFPAGAHYIGAYKRV